MMCNYGVLFVLCGKYSKSRRTPLAKVVKHGVNDYLSPLRRMLSIIYRFKCIDATCGSEHLLFMRK